MKGWIKRYARLPGMFFVIAAASPGILLLVKSLRQEAVKAQATASAALAYMTFVLIFVTAWYAYSSYGSVKVAERTATILGEELLRELRPLVSLRAQGPHWSDDRATLSFRIEFTVKGNTAALKSFRIEARCSTHDQPYSFRESDFCERTYDRDTEGELAANFDAPCSRSPTPCNPIVQASLEYSDLFGYRTYRTHMAENGKTGTEVIKTVL